MYLQYLEARLQSGTLHLHLPDGSHHRFGQGRPQVDWLLHRPRTLARILRNPARMLGETYLRQEWDVGRGQLSALLYLLLGNLPETPRSPLADRWQQLCDRLRTPLCAARDPAQFDAWLLRCFLGEDLHYQCGYFRDPDAGLEEAQRSHCRHLLQQLQLRPGQRLLDLNAHWGGLALFLAEQAQVQVTALVQNRKQLRIARQRAHRRGLHHRVCFALQDRPPSHRYDRIIAQGLLETMPPRRYAAQLQRMEALLAHDGLALVQCIGRGGPPGPANPWLRRDCFPHHYNPALSEVSRGIEASGLVTRQVDILHEHYAHTLAAWQRRFQHHRDAIAQRQGEDFCRGWEFSLAACEAGFRWRDLTLFSLQLARPPHLAPGPKRAGVQTTAGQLPRLPLNVKGPADRPGMFHGTGPD